MWLLQMWCKWLNKSLPGSPWDFMQMQHFISSCSLCICIWRYGSCCCGRKWFTSRSVQCTPKFTEPVAFTRHKVWVRSVDWSTCMHTWRLFNSPRCNWVVSWRLLWRGGSANACMPVQLQLQTKLNCNCPWMWTLVGGLKQSMLSWIEQCPHMLLRWCHIDSARL